MLTITHLTARYGARTIIDDLSYTFRPGKVYAIMGPNGSGKSTLARVLMGDPSYEVKADKLTVTKGKKEISLIDMDAHERAKIGLFLSFQSPLALQGVRVTQLLQLALSGAKSAREIHGEAARYAKDLHISPELLNRSMNEGASGGERKKIETLQAAILDKEIQIFDEIDTGVDVDAMRSIGTFLQKRKKNKIYIMITHYNRILHYLPPDIVLVLKDGVILAEGGPELADAVETEGYKKFLIA